MPGKQRLALLRANHEHPGHLLLVGGAAYKTRSETGAALIVVLAAIAVTATVLAFFAVDTLRNAPETFVAIVGIAGLSVVLDLVWKHQRGPESSGARIARPELLRRCNNGEPLTARTRSAGLHARLLP